MLSARRGIRRLAPSLLLLPALGLTAPLSFKTGGSTNYGAWSAMVRVSAAAWKPGDTVSVDAALSVTAEHLQNLAGAGIKPDSLILLVTAERTFDSGGHLRLTSDQYMSTLITPTGLPIEGGAQGAVTTRFGGQFKSPLDLFMKVPVAVLGLLPGSQKVSFHGSAALPSDMPPGIYRLRLDFGVAKGGSNYTLNGDSFANQAFFRGVAPVSYVYSPTIPVDGVSIKGDAVKAASIQARVPWVLLASYNSNGYRGVVAEEDKPYFAISPRNLIQDDVILPRFDSSGRSITYSLEPQFQADTVDACWNIPWDYASGEISVEVTRPDGVTVPLGKYPFVRQSGSTATTGRSQLTAWTPPAYGHYSVTATGWIRDVSGRRYEAGGTYSFWIANRMTLATATFEGMPYPVGSTYGRDVAFFPAVPADVTITATLYPDSDPAKAIGSTWGGKASTAGVFGALQGSKSFALSAQGEYHAKILATYSDPSGNLWVASMRHAGVVYDPNGPIVARGKKLYAASSYVARGETHDEGYIDPTNGAEHLVHINFPYQAGDVLLIASDGYGADKIIPTITYETKTNPVRNDAQLNTIGATNLQLKTSNGYSPHLYPEYITDWAYYYGAAARPGFVGRFVVGETSVRAPYWSVSPNSFGGQINASVNGDMVGDIYRLMGGVVLRQAGAAPAYAGYISSAFMLPKGEKNNRIVEAGSEDLISSTGQRGRAFLVGPRPGSTYPVGTTFGAAFQIDPIVPVAIKFTLTFPDGRVVTTSGTSDAYGSFSGKDRWVLDTPGLYKYNVEASWNGFPAVMPGLPKDGGDIYVLEAKMPEGAKGIQITTADGSTVDAVAGGHIVGLTTASTVHYAVMIPGAVLDQGELNVTGGQFDYYFNPAGLHNRAQTFDVADRNTGKAILGDAVHIALFTTEKMSDGTTYHSYQRVVVRGNQIRVAK
jgi:hypothetical protein